MKIEATKKHINNLYENKIELGYCSLYDILHTVEEPMYYTCGVYGWNADIYYIDRNTVIVTGCRPFGNIKPDYKIVKKYENKSKRISEKYNSFTDFDKKKKAFEELLKSFVEEALNA